MMFPSNHLFIILFKLYKLAHKQGHKMSSKEEQFCQKQAIDPQNFLMIKEFLIRSCRKELTLKKEDILKKIPLKERKKACRRIFDFMLEDNQIIEGEDQQKWDDFGL